MLRVDCDLTPFSLLMWVTARNALLVTATLDIGKSPSIPEEKL